MLSWDCEWSALRSMCVLLQSLMESQTYTSSKGLTVEDVGVRTALHGENRFVVPIPSFWVLYQEHMLAPFFVFQMFCVGLWCLDEFWHYALFTLAMLLLFESICVKSVRVNSRKAST